MIFKPWAYSANRTAGYEYPLRGVGGSAALTGVAAKTAPMKTPEIQYTLVSKVYKRIRQVSAAEMDWHTSPRVEPKATHSVHC